MEGIINPQITIPDLPDETLRALRQRAETHGHDLESEIIAILDAAVRPAERLKIGTAIFDICRRNGVTTADVEALERAWDARPAEPMRLE